MIANNSQVAIAVVWLAAAVFNLPFLSQSFLDVDSLEPSTSKSPKKSRLAKKNSSKSSSASGSGNESPDDAASPPKTPKSTKVQFKEPGSSSNSNSDEGSLSSLSSGEGLPTRNAWGSFKSRIKNMFSNKSKNLDISQPFNSTKKTNDFVNEIRDKPEFKEFEKDFNESQKQKLFQPFVPKTLLPVDPEVKASNPNLFDNPLDENTNKPLNEFLMPVGVYPPSKTAAFKIPKQVKDDSEQQSEQQSDQAASSSGIVPEKNNESTDLTTKSVKTIPSSKPVTPEALKNSPSPLPRQRKSVGTSTTQDKADLPKYEDVVIRIKPSSKSKKPAPLQLSMDKPLKAFGDRGVLVLPPVEAGANKMKFQTFKGPFNTTEKKEEPIYENVPRCPPSRLSFSRDDALRSVARKQNDASSDTPQNIEVLYSKPILKKNRVPAATHKKDSMENNQTSNNNQTLSVTTDNIIRELDDLVRQLEDDKESVILMDPVQIKTSARQKAEIIPSRICTIKNDCEQLQTEEALATAQPSTSQTETIPVKKIEEGNSVDNKDQGKEETAEKGVDSNPAIMPKNKKIPPATLPKPKAKQQASQDMKENNMPQNEGVKKNPHAPEIIGYIRAKPKTPATVKLTDNKNTLPSFKERRQFFERQ